VTTRETYLERIDCAKNMARYYRLSVVETLFGEWAMVREWGRIGRRGHSREHVFNGLGEAEARLRWELATRTKRGYVPQQG
jgi:predicted DNA-binding WGR domain protein